MLIFVWQLIELWETYLMQFDADEDGSPFLGGGVPASIAAKPASESEGTPAPTTQEPSATIAATTIAPLEADEEANGAPGREDSEEPTISSEGQTDSHAAAIATAETEA